MGNVTREEMEKAVSASAKAERAMNRVFLKTGMCGQERAVVDKAKADVRELESRAIAHAAECLAALERAVNSRDDVANGESPRVNELEVLTAAREYVEAVQVARAGV